jgi:E1A-binding protein p400
MAVNKDFEILDLSRNFPNDLPLKRVHESGDQVQSVLLKPSEKPEKSLLKPSIVDLHSHYKKVLEKSSVLKSNFGKKMPPIAEPSKNTTTWDYLLAEMEWMSTYFEKERKTKTSNAKKCLKGCQQTLKSRKDFQEKQEAEDIKLRSRIIGKICKIVQKYWKSVEKIAIHVGTLQQEEKRQQSRNKKLDRLVDKHLELSAKVAKKLVASRKPVNLVLRRVDQKWQVDEEYKFDDEEFLENYSKPLLCTPLPFMMKHSLREYQRVGLDWMVALHDKRLNGILADEMGLGKTIQTIALFAYLACERGVWGPHLIVVPTSIVINWEMELKKWCPGLKVLTYFGSQKERKMKRVGWSKFNSFNVCITSYKLVVQDQFAFKRKQWYYLVLDEAQHIKNFCSQRWQVLLKFNSKRRLLLSGTPLQNDVMELWSLLHFLMPNLFHSHQDFYDWFSSPFNSSMMENTEFSLNIIQRLHSILRPFVLRRMKKDVEKQLPDKIEHIVFCNLSRRQQFLYDEFLERRYSNKEDCVGIMNILMQLRKVCNHPDLFAPRAVASPFYMSPLKFKVNFMFVLDLKKWTFGNLSMRDDFDLVENDLLQDIIPRTSKQSITSLQSLQAKVALLDPRPVRLSPFFKYDLKPIYGFRLLSKLNLNLHHFSSKTSLPLQKSLKSRLQDFSDIFYYFQTIQPKIETGSVQLDLNRNNEKSQTFQSQEKIFYSRLIPILSSFHFLLNRLHLLFPDRKSIEHDCGKLRKLSNLLSDLKREGHKCVIFTQMAKMLDILENFMNIHGHSYLRLDGSTRVEQRQRVVDLFNLDAKIFCFISSTRSGGLGINLTGADVVIFYDTDWNPAMDKQAQDRCHRIGQTRNVHIYRLISSYTIEENILKKSMQKTHLDNLVMEGGQFTTVFLQNQKTRVKEFFENIKDDELEAACQQVEDTEDQAALNLAKEEDRLDNQDFEDGQYGFLEQLDCVTQKCIEKYLEEHPVECLDSSATENESECESSQSEDMAVDMIYDGEKVYKEYLNFLKSRYLVY